MTHRMPSGKTCGLKDGHKGKCCSVEAYARQRERNRIHTRRYWAKHGEERNRISRERYHENREQWRPKGALDAARRRAREKDIPFGLTMETLPPIPSHCPALGVKLQMGNGRQGPDSPSLDRLIPGRGYVPGNVFWISLRANSIKQDATPAELRKVADWIESQAGCDPPDSEV